MKLFPAQSRCLRARGAMATYYWLTRRYRWRVQEPLPAGPLKLQRILGHLPMGYQPLKQLCSAAGTCQSHLLPRDCESFLTHIPCHSCPARPCSRRFSPRRESFDSFLNCLVRRAQLFGRMERLPYPIDKGYFLTVLSDVFRPVRIPFPDSTTR